ncbi:SAM-dependent methyltransferase, MidA family [Roseateles sp. YR242]|uniref:class I SAM-dependent methyltransferase n=1 Tax=Roseateles sp. YR242 TaxID=1855305 RepID=UPI0008AEACBA|nr:SAM-dependent methyltransferase [Roseateles sp. YR242]SEL49630.1 SAM-dependent methyltransferase, MidA family [Roseateles sp. YR242]
MSATSPTNGSDVNAGQAPAFAEAMTARLRQAITDAGGWLPFDRYMSLALYEPGLGYYANSLRKFGTMPRQGSDFVTAPELSPLFGRALARQVAQALQVSGTDTVIEFGAGSGALAEQLIETLDALGTPVARYQIVDLSGTLRERQAERLRRFAPRVQWLDRWPEEIHGVLVANELLDAMPVQLLLWTGADWLARGVEMEATGSLRFSDRATAARPPTPPEADVGFVPGTVTEVHAQAEAFVRTLADHLKRGAAFFIDYGFPESEYYHPQRTGGTLMCHHLHQADPDPLDRPGQKDITTHVNFTGIALAGQEAGMTVLGYTSQANFLINCGLVDLLQEADLVQRTMAHRLIAEHEMGELFKVIGFVPGEEFDAIGFSVGDRSYTL